MRKKTFLISPQISVNLGLFVSLIYKIRVFVKSYLVGIKSSLLSVKKRIHTVFGKRLDLFARYFSSKCTISMIRGDCFISGVFNNMNFLITYFFQLIYYTEYIILLSQNPKKVILIQQTILHLRKSQCILVDGGSRER